MRFWGIHCGDGKILDHLQSRRGLTDAQLDFSRTLLREHGNMSSPTILSYWTKSSAAAGRPPATAACYSPFRA